MFGTLGVIAGAETAKAGDISILAGGELQFGALTADDDLLSEGQGDRGYAFFAETELLLRADVSPSAGGKIGAQIKLEADADKEDANADEAYIFMSDAFGLIQVGRRKGAEDVMALGADTIASGAGGLDGDAKNLGVVKVINSEDASKVSYFTPRIAGFQVGASFTPDTGDDEGGATEIEDAEEQEFFEDHVGLGVNFLHKLGEVGIGVAVVGSYGQGIQNGHKDLSAYSIGGTLALDDLEIGVSYGETKAADVVDFATIGATLGFGEASAGVGYNHVDKKTDGVTHILVLSGDMEVLKGAKLQADVSYAYPAKTASNVASVLAVELAF